MLFSDWCQQTHWQQCVDKCDDNRAWQFVVPTYTWRHAEHRSLWPPGTPSFPLSLWYFTLWCLPIPGNLLNTVHSDAGTLSFSLSVCLSHTVVQTYRWPAPCTVPYMGSWRHCGPCVGTLLFACHISHSLFVGYFSHGVIAPGNKSTVSDKDPRPKMINPLPWWNFNRTCTSLCSLKVNICSTCVLCVPLIVRIRQCIHHLRLRREGGGCYCPFQDPNQQPFDPESSPQPQLCQPSLSQTRKH